MAKKIEKSIKIGDHTKVQLGALKGITSVQELQEKEIFSHLDAEYQDKAYQQLLTKIQAKAEEPAAEEPQEEAATESAETATISTGKRKSK